MFCQINSWNIHKTGFFFMLGSKEVLWHETA
jgi:hypothetical protein